MEKVEIKAPMWDGELRKRCVGIADFRIKGDLEVHITYTRKDGTRTYPNPFRISYVKARSYPIKKWKGISLYIIPIEDMEEIIS